MPQRRHDTLADLIGWAALGLGCGLIAGLFLGEWQRPRRQPDDQTDGPDATPRTIAQTVTAVRNALDQHGEFHALGITVRALAPGMVEVGGWVADRATRARVIRFTQTVPGIRDVLDSLLVHGEDDLHLRHHWSQANPES